MRTKVFLVAAAVALVAAASAFAGNGSGQGQRHPLHVPRPAHRDPGERRRSDHRRGRQPCRAPRDARPARDADVRVRHEHRVPEVGERHPDRRPARRPRRRRLRPRQRPRRTRRVARRHRAARSRDRRRSRHAALPADAAALSLPRDADLGRNDERRGARHRRQRTRHAPAARPVRRPVVRLRRPDDLPALAGQGADGDRRLAAEGGRPDRRPRPRRQGLLARPGGVDSGEAHRRPRARANRDGRGQPPPRQPSFGAAARRFTDPLRARAEKRTII